jgi:hypothetical protein
LDFGRFGLAGGTALSHRVSWVFWGFLKLEFNLPAVATNWCPINGYTQLFPYVFEYESPAALYLPTLRKMGSGGLIRDFPLF